MIVAPPPTRLKSRLTGWGVVVGGCFVLLLYCIVIVISFPPAVMPTQKGRGTAGGIPSNMRGDGCGGAKLHLSTTEVCLCVVVCIVC